MRVFRHLVVVGVGAAITFSNVGRSAATPPLAQSQDTQPETNQLKLGPDLKSAPKTAGERNSQEGYVPAMSPPTQSQEAHTKNSSVTSSLQLGTNFKSASKPTGETSQKQEMPVAEPMPDRKADLTLKRGLGAVAIAPPKSKQKFSGSIGTIQIATNGKSNTAQAPSPTVEPVEIPAPGTSPLTPSEMAPSPAPTRTPLESFPPLTPNGTLQTQPPEFLEPNPNPLSFPTRPDEVRIERTQPITLQQAIDLAHRNSQTFQIAQLQLEQSQAVVREQQAALYPDLSVQVDLNRQISAGGELGVRAQERRRNVLESQGQPVGGPDPQNFGSNTLNTTLQLTYNVDLFGVRTANIRAAQEQQRFRELEVERIGEELRFDVSTNYYNLQDADGRVAIGEAAVRNAGQSLRDAEALERAGVGTRFAVLQAQVNLANEQQRLNEARRDQLVRRRQLAEILNISQSVELTAADPVEQAGSWKLSLEESIVLALKNRAELEQQLVQRAVSEQQRRSIVAGRKPQLNLFANYNVLGVDPDEGDYFASRGFADGYSVGARLTWNFFDGGAAQARTQQREFDIAIAETRFDQLRNQVRREVEQGYFELESSFASIETAETGVLQAREALRLARLRFQAGVGTQTDVIQAETDLTRSERNRLLAIIGYNRALSALERAVTNLPGNDLSDTP
ncbi:TolC family protein [Kamptonema sp. UHCC 0994]|uniref:TolC family protein n=1 Tax=Kamptonema sp. UHCC 0994 TaxID=3031329 RepID=UPI0023B96CB4|nr:TolC family protein [Kamptonema sp. UHCC 0994]MDF0554513.1 TolC family protein [Kamptonema sp. UHCC 0994]